jgi:adenine deaminase
VPATAFETAGAEISAADIDVLLIDPRIPYLSEMMNWPGVLGNDPEVLAKLAVARRHGKPVDGHAPGLEGAQAGAYAAHGISTDHECGTLEEAAGKLAVGMKILIREGSAARNFEALNPVIGSHPHMVMFCCDDAHPDMLLGGHIDRHVRRAMALGYNSYDVLRAASMNPVQHYGLNVGLLQEGDPADFIVVNNLEELVVQQTWIKGELVAKSGTSRIPRTPVTRINKFNRGPITEADLAIPPPALARVIVAHDGQLVTSEVHLSPTDPNVHKLCVVNRYSSAPVAVAYIKGFGLQAGALASSVAHDSHNIVACGVDDTSIAAAVNAVIAEQGGLSVVADGENHVLPLPVAGLMSDADAWQVAELYSGLDARAKALGTSLQAPFMTLSFMALLVIPQLKLSDRGLFDGQQFVFVDLEVES